MLIERRPKNKKKNKTFEQYNVSKIGLHSEQIEKINLQSEKFRKRYNIHRLEKEKQKAAGHESFDKKKANRQKKINRTATLGELVYVLAERLKKKDAPSG